MKTILAKIKPSKKEAQRFKSTVNSFLTKLNKNLKDAAAILGGSGAKGTWLSGNYDVDIFVQYNYKKYSPRSAELSTYLEPILKKTFPKIKLEGLHGSRDYFRLPYDGINFEVVPILKLKKSDEAVNITDVSPLHAKWVNTYTKKTKDNILLAKQFCKANGMYGAESYIGGFSGYVLEIFITHYGSFEKLLKASQNWKIKEVIDVEKHYPKKDALFHLNQSKLHSPLIVIDPVDKNRNAAAALSLEKMELFRTKAKEYLQKPREELFIKTKKSLEFIQKEACGNPFVYITLQPSSGKEDVVGAKVRKVFEFIERELEPFSPLKTGWEMENPAVLYFIVKTAALPETEIKVGPPLKLKDHVAAFKQKYTGTYEENGKIYAKVKREYPTLKEFVAHLLKQKYVKEHIKKIESVTVSP